jgi:nicotinamide-nucleotide amidase
MKRAAESRHPSERQHEKQPVEVFVMPGVPKEMKIMFTRDVLPHIAAAGKGAVILPRTLHTFGLGESSVAEKLGDLMNRQRNPSVGTTVANGIVSLRVNARFDSREEAERRLDETADACRTALGDLIFGQDDETLPQVAASLLTSNQQPATSNSLTVSTAESCTGGLLAKMLTDIPGSSRYFKQGWVTYSNQAKYERLGVSMEIINVYGAVSENVVELMATHARRLAKSDYALAISGIAGPDGGTPIKPVGTVCIALAWPDPADKKSSVVEKRTFLFPGDREMIRDRSAKMALTMLRYHLLERKMPF